MKRNSVWIALLLSAVALVGASCAPPPDMRGNLPEKTTLDQIKPGETDKAAVTKLLGSPSSVATFDSNTWYYISQETQNVAFFKPDLLDEHVVSIKFDDKGIVTKIAFLDLKDHRQIAMNPNATPAPGREFTIVEQLVGNFGRFSGPSDSTSPSTPGPGH
jgi:outer membrane protein assembly factor BamE (lipoprotein component of BamABCDE complex)